MRIPNLLPLVSCVMPTRDRPCFLQQSIKYFQRQDYPNLELIIVDDGQQDLADCTRNQKGVRYVRLPTVLTIGAKRNYGCAIARGEIIAQWDDDDWYGPSRISAQVTSLIASNADIDAFGDCVFLELDSWRFWRCSANIFERMFVGNVHGGTLVFKRKLFDSGTRYPVQSLAEDAYFLYLCNRQGARLHRTGSHGMFVYLRHSKNMWQFECGRHLDPLQWQMVTPPEIPLEDQQFLEAQASLSRGAST